MSAKAGINKFGEDTVSAMMKEYVQLDEGAFPGKPVIQPVNPDEVLREEHM